MELDQVSAPAGETSKVTLACPWATADRPAAAIRDTTALVARTATPPNDEGGWTFPHTPGNLHPVAAGANDLRRFLGSRRESWAWDCKNTLPETALLQDCESGQHLFAHRASPKRGRADCRIGRIPEQTRGGVRTASAKPVPRGVRYKDWPRTP